MFMTNDILRNCCCPQRLFICLGLDKDNEHKEETILLPSSSQGIDSPSIPNCSIERKQPSLTRYQSMDQTKPHGKQRLQSRKSEPSIKVQNRPSVSEASNSGSKNAAEDLKLAVMGSVRVGKTALVNQFQWKVFISEYKPTVEEFNWIEYELGEEGTFMLQIIDTSGSHEFLGMRQLYIKKADAFLLVFSVDDPSSFTEIQQLYADISEQSRKNPPILLVANKADIYNDESEWLVSEEEILKFVTESKLPYTALTAKDTETVQQVFRQVLLKTRSVEILDRSKRRQSMPVVHGRGSMNLDPKDLAKIRAAAELSEKSAKGHDKNCVIS